MGIDRLTLCVAISSLISTISLIEKSGMELGVIEWMSSPFQRYIKYPALIACLLIFISPRWSQKGKRDAADEAAAAGSLRDGDSGGDSSSAGGAQQAQAIRGAGVATGGGGSKKKRAKALRARHGQGAAATGPSDHR
jgi:hypothetical protein